MSSSDVILTLCVHMVPNGPEFSSRSVVGTPGNFKPRSILVLEAGLISTNCLFLIILTLPFLGVMVTSLPNFLSIGISFS
jgi:hypothetical protein